MSDASTPSNAFGPNAWLVDEMHEQYLADPLSVSEAWREFFADYRNELRPSGQVPAVGAAVPSAARSAPAAAPAPPKPVPAPAPTPTAAAATPAADSAAAEPLRGASARIVL